MIVLKTSEVSVPLACIYNKNEIKKIFGYERNLILIDDTVVTVRITRENIDNANDLFVSIKKENEFLYKVISPLSPGKKYEFEKITCSQIYHTIFKVHTHIRDAEKYKWNISKYLLHNFKIKSIKETTFLAIDNKKINLNFIYTSKFSDMLFYKLFNLINDILINNPLLSECQKKANILKLVSSIRHQSNKKIKYATQVKNCNVLDRTYEDIKEGIESYTGTVREPLPFSNNDRVIGSPYTNPEVPDIKINGASTYETLMPVVKGIPDNLSQVELKKGLRDSYKNCVMDMKEEFFNAYTGEQRFILMTLTSIMEKEVPKDGYYYVDINDLLEAITGIIYRGTKNNTLKKHRKFYSETRNLSPKIKITSPEYICKNEKKRYLVEFEPFAFGTVSEKVLKDKYTTNATIIMFHPTNGYLKFLKANKQYFEIKLETRRILYSAGIHKDIREKIIKTFLWIKSSYVRQQQAREYKIKGYINNISKNTDPRTYHTIYNTLCKMVESEGIKIDSECKTGTNTIKLLPKNKEEKRK